MGNDYKKVTCSGSVGIPVALRRELNMQRGDAVELEHRGDGSIIIRHYVPRCIFCDNTEGVRIHNGKGICGDCAEIISKLGGVPDETNQ